MQGANVGKLPSVEQKDTTWKKREEPMWGGRGNTMPRIRIKKKERLGHKYGKERRVDDREALANGLYTLGQTPKERNRSAQVGTGCLTE